MTKWELLEKNNFDKSLIAKELNINIDSKELNELIDKIILDKIKELNKCKKIEEQLQGFDKREVLKASSLTTKRIENNYEFLEKILKSSNKEEVIDLCLNSFYKFNKNNLFAFCLGYCNLNQCLDKLDIIQENILTKLKFYNDYKKRKRMGNNKNIAYNNDNKIKIEKVLRLFIESDYDNVDDFLSNYNLMHKNEKNYNYITKYSFSYYLKIILSNDINIYKMYKEKLNNVLKSRENYIINVSRIIIDKIKNGIEEDGIKRKFDIIDYYLETNLDPNMIINVLLKYDMENAIIFKDFIKKYRSMQPLYNSFRKSIIEEKTVVDVEFDSKGVVIPNSGRIVTKEEKEKIFEYLINNNIPLYDVTYDVALKRYLNNSIKFDNKVKVK